MRNAIRTYGTGIAALTFAGLGLLLAASAFGADTQVLSKIFPRSVTFKENGDVLPLGKVFTNVDQFDFPNRGEITSDMFNIMDGFGNIKAAIVGNHIFLEGKVFQNQSVFPGGTSFRRASGSTIASFGNDGNLYINKLLEDVSSCVAPVYEPSKWNSDPVILGTDNCYNYANNQPTETDAQPGRASNSVQGGAPSVARVKAEALSDGLIWVGTNFPGNGYTCANSRSLVFLAVAPGKDYHWYRLDKVSGTWSGKRGFNPATNLDASNKVITNPLTANRHYPDPDPSMDVNYTDNGGFYCTCSSDANIR